MNFLEKYSKYSVLVLRIGLGIAFIAHGWQKFNGIGYVVQFFGTLGFPSFFAYLAAYGELLGGLAVLFGAFTRYASGLIAAILIVAIFKVKLSTGFLGGYELDFAFLAMSISLMLSGAGNHSLDKKYKL